jgi:hypothetical protein
MNIQIDLLNTKSNHKKYKQNNNINFGANLYLTNNYSDKLSKFEPEFLDKINSIKDKFSKQTSSDSTGIVQIIKDRGIIKRNRETGRVIGQISLIYVYSNQARNILPQLSHINLPERDLGNMERHTFLSQNFENDRMFRKQILDKYESEDLLTILSKANDIGPLANEPYTDMS